MWGRLRDVPPYFDWGGTNTSLSLYYFTKWAEAIPTYKANRKTASFFILNQIIARFGIPKEIVTDHGSHFQNRMMTELTIMLGFKQ